MAVYTKELLSGSTSGRPIPVAATATPGTLVHTAVAGADAFDEIYLWAANVSAAPKTLTLEWGGVGDPTDHAAKQFRIPAYSPPIPIMTGQVLNGGLEVRAFGSAASDINITGFVNRIEE